MFFRNIDTPSTRSCGCLVGKIGDAGWGSRSTDNDQTPLGDTVMTSDRKRTFGVMGSRLCGQLDLNATYLCGFGEVEDQDAPDHRRGRKFVVCLTPSGKVNILEIDDWLDQTNR